MKRSWLLGLILLTILNVSALGALLYHRVVDEDPCGRVARPVFLRPELGLSAEQIRRLQPHREEFHRRVASYSDDMHRQRLQLVAQLMAEQPDSLELERMLREMGTLQMALQREVVQHLLAEKAVFTPAQRERFFALVLERFTIDVRGDGPRPQGDVR